jgi:hypothetical protein
MAMKRNKEMIGGLLAMILVISLIAFVSADTFCKRNLGNNEWVPVWPGYSSTGGNGNLICRDGRCTCHLNSGTGYCRICTNSSGWYASDTKCKGLLCEDTTPHEEQPLTMTANFPFPEGGVFTKQSFFLDIQTNKIANIDLIDNVAESSRNLCPNCASYQKNANFKQGFNDITIRAVKGTEFQEKRITFFIDNIKPRITKTLPLANKYASGDFSVVYDEANVKKVEMFYGLKGSPINTELSGCASGKAQTCAKTVDLTALDGKEVYYWFKITDVANMVAESKPVKIFIDKTFPVITNFNYSVSRNSVSFNIAVDEKNMNKIAYYDNDDPKAKTLCTSLNKGWCKKKVTFKSGPHDVDIQVSDKAGNVVSRTISFEID